MCNSDALAGFERKKKKDYKEEKPMKKKNRFSRLVRLFSLMLATCTLLSAAAFQTAEAAGEEPEHLTVALSGDILALDPHQTGGTPTETIKAHVFEPLITLESDGSFSPCLATSWEIEEGNSAWVFHLREGVKFHDGSDFTAEDVVASYERLINNEYGANRVGDFPGFIGAEAIDDYTVRLITDGPVGNFLNLLSYGGGAIMSSEAIETYKDDVAAHPIGTGPYQVTDFESGDHAEVEVFPDYWGDIPQIEVLRFVTVPEASTRSNMLLAQEAGFAVDIEVNDVESVDASDVAEIRYDETNRVAQIGFNLTRKPFDDPRVREAMNYAINKDLIVSGIMGGAAIVTNNVVAPNVFGYIDGDFTYDPDRAKELLAEAGYPDGFEVTLWTPQGRYYKDRETCLAVASQLAEVGITVNVEVHDWASYLSELRVPLDEGNEVEMYLLGWECYTCEAGYTLGALFTERTMPPNGWNIMFYTNPEVEDLVEQIRQTMDADARLDLIHQALEIVSADAPWIPLYTHTMISGQAENLEGVYILPTQLPRFEKAYFS